MFHTTTISNINCDLMSLIYAFEFDVVFNNKIVSIVKVGKTNKTIRERIIQYNEKNIKNICWVQVQDNIKIERELINYLHNQLKLEIYKGREYFITSIEIVKEAIYNLIPNIKDQDNEEKFNLSINPKLEENFQCDNCTKIFKSKAGFSNHVKTCKDKSNIQCKYCTKLFSTKGTLQAHYLSCKQKEIEEIKNEVEQLHLNDIEKLKMIYEARIKDLEFEVRSKNEQIVLLKEMKSTITNNTANNYLNNSSTKIGNINANNDTIKNKENKLDIIEYKNEDETR